jgi:regulator of protease activity HflC (stomatin/prohibitin superfamily)
VVAVVALLIAIFARKNGGYVVSGIAVGLAILSMVFCMFGSISTGHVGVLSLFGKIDMETVLEEGFYTKNPLKSVNEMTVRRQEFTRHGTAKESDEGVSGAMRSIAKGGLELTIDVTVPYRINPKYAPAIYRHLGDDDKYTENLIKPSAATAVRDGAARFVPDEAYETKKDSLALVVTRNFVREIVGQIREFEAFKGLSPSELERVIIPLPVQIRKVFPPEKVRNAIAEKLATLEDLERQKTLTEIAEEEASRRGKEGLGMKNFLSNLPKSTSARDAIGLLNATANMERAKALKKLADEGKVTAVYVGNNPVAIRN